MNGLLSRGLLWINLTDYVDYATGIMVVNPDGSGQFIEVTLNPTVTIADEAHLAKANDLHHEANKLYFIANSLNFPVKHNAESRV